MKAVLVKWGGSLITDKQRAATVRRGVLQRLARELAEALAATDASVVLGHGSGSFGHVMADRYGLQHGLRREDQRPGISRTQHQAARLHQLVVGALLEAGLCPFSMAPSSAAVAEGGRPVRFQLEPLQEALRLGLLPVLYGDILLSSDQGASICSTESVLLAAAQFLRAQGVTVRAAFWLGDTDGIYDAEGNTIPVIEAGASESARASITSPEGADVTGGMRLRLETACALARLDIPSWMVSGHVGGVQTMALEGRALPGTQVLAISQFDSDRI